MLKNKKEESKVTEKDENKEDEQTKILIGLETFPWVIAMLSPQFRHFTHATLMR